MRSCSASSGPSWSRRCPGRPPIGDRSENGDYIYGRKQLREIDRRLGYLAKVMKAAKVVEPGAAGRRDQVRFGATVELADEEIPAHV